MFSFHDGGRGLWVGAQRLSITGLCEICGLALIACVSTACCRACLKSIGVLAGYCYCELPLAEPHPVAGLCVLILLHGGAHLLL